MTKSNIYRMLGGVLGAFCVIMSPLFLYVMHGWDKLVIIPIIGFGLLFLKYAVKGNG